MIIKNIVAIIPLIAFSILGGCSRLGGVDNPVAPSSVTPKVYMDPASTSVGNGNIFTTSIYIENVTDLYYAAFYVVYDPLKIAYNSGAAGDFLKQGGVNVDFAAAGSEQPAGNGLVKRSIGITRLDTNTPKTGVSGTGVLCTLTFKALAAGTANLSFSSDPNDQGFMNLNNASIQITVGSGETVNIH